MNICRSLALCTIGIVVMLTSGSVCAQYHWMLTHTDFDGRYYYCFDAVDCSGDVCTAVGTVVDSFLHRIVKSGFRSTDGGSTWVVQSMQLPEDSAYSKTDTRSRFMCTQQINENTTVAVGAFPNSVIPGSLSSYDSTLIVRTNDGGTTWTRQDLGVRGRVLVVNFSDAMNGTLIANLDTIFTIDQVNHDTSYIPELSNTVYTTTDGGQHWVGHPDRVDATNCKTNGAGSYALFIVNYPGIIKTTSDNGTTYSSSATVIDPAADTSRSFILKGCTFISSDTIIAYGTFVERSVTGHPTEGFLCHSFDHGSSWSTPTVFPEFTSISTVSQASRDTILAGGDANNYVLMSTDRGETWVTDSLLLDTAYPSHVVRSLVYTATHGPLMLATDMPDNLGIPSVLAIGAIAKSSVAYDQPLQYHDRIFPNPAKSTVNIASIESSTPYRIIDMLGREVKTVMVGDHTTVTVDVSSLPRGIYYLLVDNPSGTPIIAGKLSLVAQ